MTDESMHDDKSMNDDGIPFLEGTPVFDRTDLMYRLGGDETIADQVLALYRKTSAASFAELDRAIEERDTERTTRIAHTIAGSAGNVSAKRLRIAALALESSVKDGDFGAAARLARSVRAEWAAAFEEMGR